MRQLKRAIDMEGAPPAGKGAPMAPKGKGKGSKGGPPPPPKARPGGGKGAAAADAAKHIDEDAAAGPKLKPLFWTSMRQAQTNTVWTKMMPSAQLDMAALEKRFALATAAEQLPISRVPSMADEARKRLRILDERTHHRLSIEFGLLPPPKVLAAAIDNFEDFPESLPTQAVLALHAAVTKEQETLKQLQLLSPFEAESRLDGPESFLWLFAASSERAAKLACGALIVGPAGELRDYRYAGVALGTCCRQLRESSLLQRFLATSLAAGNIINRGTARSGARALVLPDSLLNCAALRESGAADEQAGGRRGLTLVDFVAQALVVEDVRRGIDPRGLQQEAQELLVRVRAAKAVAIEEVDINQALVFAEAERAQQIVVAMPAAAGVERVRAKIERICEEARVAQVLVQGARKELKKTQAFLSAKGDPKSEDWLAGWAQVLDHLVQALGRAQPLVLPATTLASSLGITRVASASCASDYPQVAAVAGATGEGLDMKSLSRTALETSTVPQSAATSLKDPTKPTRPCALFPQSSLPLWHFEDENKENC